MNYWLFKTEPDEFSIDDLADVETEHWSGIRNYQARNILRDDVKARDLVFIYHSSCNTIGIAGIGKIVTDGYVDPDQFDPQNNYYDPKAMKDYPLWYRVDVEFVERFPEIVPLATLKECPDLVDMVLLKQSRLSIQPVTTEQWQFIGKLARS